MTMVLSSTPRSFELLEQRADLLVVLEHLGANDVCLGAAFVDGHLDVLLLRMRPDVDRGRVEPDEERLVALAVAVQVVERLVENFGVEGLHALARQRAGVLDLLLADAAELRDRSVGSSTSVAQVCSTPRGPNFC